MKREQSHQWAVRLARQFSNAAPADMVAAVAELVGSSYEPGAGSKIVGDARAPRELVNELAKQCPENGWSNPGLVGLIHEQAVSFDERRRRGAWYTPRGVVQGLIEMATSDQWQPTRIIDPTCGGGAFLLAALDYLHTTGLSPHQCAARVSGMDIDQFAVTASCWSIRLWLMSKGCDPDTDSGVGIERGDALVDQVPGMDGAGPVLVAGNPPFASPLKTGAVRPPYGLLGPYADTAAEHLLRAVETVPDGSRVVLVQPQSVLSGRDTESLRAYFDAEAPLCGLWVAREPVFDAGVRACAPLVEVGGNKPETVRLAAGPDVTPVGERTTSDWGVLGAAALGAPPLPSPMLSPESGDAATLGELVSCTAGFRDEHYGLVGACVEANEQPDLVDRLITVGTVDPLTCWWGHRPIRFGGTSWERPVIDPSQLNTKVRAWFERQRHPKVLLATQTKILEPVVDHEGNMVPSTPLIAVHCSPNDLDKVAAVLLAPPVVLWAWGRWFGTALASDAIKLAARQVADLPLPVDNQAWEQAAAIVAQTDPTNPSQAWTQTREIGLIMTRAYQADDEVYEWWVKRAKPLPAMPAG